MKSKKMGGGEGRWFGENRWSFEIFDDLSWDKREKEMKNKNLHAIYRFAIDLSLSS